MRKWFAVALSTAVTMAGLAWGARAVRSLCWWGEAICPGIRVGGELLDPEADIDARLGERARELAARVVSVTVAGSPDASRTFALGDLGVVLDVARTASLVHAIGHSGPAAARFAEARRASRGEIEVPLFVNVDEDVARAALMPIKDETDDLPVPARLDLVHGGIIDEIPGHFVDLDAAIEQVQKAALSRAETIELDRVAAPPRVSRAFLVGVDSREKLARFQTSFSRNGDQELRAHNIETAAARLDGVVLLPHEVFSFNTVVGPRTVENGFSKGWEIFKGEMVEGVGGGTCQAASTLHAAAFLSGLDVIERLPHSRPSAYITMGLDATVVYPVVDLKLRNPYEFPVVIHGYVEGSTVVFEILGRERPARVTFGREILATRAYVRKIEEKPGLPADRIVRRQHGIPGYKIKRTRTIAFRDGTARIESNVDIYWPTIELFEVAPGTDVEGKLPPAGEGLDESGKPGWVPPPPAETTSPPESSPSAAGAVAGSTEAPALAGCSTADCVQPDGAAKIVEAPGVHAPRAEQLRAPIKVVIGIGDGPRRP